MTRKIFAVAHRGYSSRWPENTVSGALAAIRAGADLVEADVRLSADGTLFCFHDPDLSRLTGEPDRIEACSDERLRSVRYDGESPAAFAEIIDTTTGRSGLLVDVKLTTREMTDALHRALDAADWPDDVWLGIRDAAQVAEVRERFEDRVRILAFMPSIDQKDAFMTNGADALRLWEGQLVSDAACDLRDQAPIWITAGNVDGRKAGDVDDMALKTIVAFAPQAVLLNDPTVLGTGMP